MENKILNISPAPHVHKKGGVNEIMIDMIIALLPAAGVGIYFYGGAAIKTILAAVLASLGAEMLWNKFVKKKNLITDISPVVSGLIFALILPTYLPMWIVVVGAIFATIVVKQFFGGLGQNFMNPAGAAKMFLITSWAAIMAKPVGLVMPPVAKDLTVFEKALAFPRGNIGEASIVAILIGALYLVIRGRINLRAPFAFLASAYALNYFAFEKTGLLPAAFFFAAFFMCTDYSTTPMTKRGQYIFGALAGILASLIVTQGYNPEGPYYAVVMLNLTTPMIEYFTTKRFKGEVA